MNTEKVGKVIQVIGPVVDVEFEGHLPAIYSAVRVVSEKTATTEAMDVVVEVQHHPLAGPQRKHDLSQRRCKRYDSTVHAVACGRPRAGSVFPSFNR